MTSSQVKTQWDEYLLSYKFKAVAVVSAGVLH